MCVAASRTGSVKQLPSWPSLQLSLYVCLLFVDLSLTLEGPPGQRVWLSTGLSVAQRFPHLPTLPFSTTQPAC